MLAILHKANGSKVEWLRKDIISLFKDEGLSITINTNFIETDFVDVSFNLNTRKYFPFKKHPYIYTQNPTTHRQSSSNCHQWPTNAFQAYPVTKLSLTKLRLRTKRHLKTVDTKQHWNSRNYPKIQNEIEIGRWPGSIRSSAWMLRQT